MKVVWSATAREDRRQIFRYLAERNPVAALRIDEALGRAAERLAETPDRGRPGREPGTRELASVLPYLLIYEADRQRQVVRMLRVWHTSRDRS